MRPPRTAHPEDEATIEAEATLAQPAAAPAEQLCFVGRILALTYDDRGRCDGFVLELGCGTERCFEAREPVLEAAVRRALAARTPAVIFTAAASPRRPVAIFPGEA